MAAYAAHWRLSIGARAGRRAGEAFATMSADNDPTQTWSTIITPKRPLFDIPFAELWKYRDLIILSIRRDLIARERYLVPNSIVVSRGCPHVCDFCYKEAFFEGVTAVREALRGRATPVGEGGARLAETS